MFGYLDCRIHRMAKYGYPETYGVQGNGHCGHCNGRPEFSGDTAYGRFCFECFRWSTYTGPPQWWGDGMNVTDRIDAR